MGAEPHFGSNQDNSSLAKKVSPLTTGLGGTSSCDTNLGSALMHPWGTVALRVLGGEEREEKEKGEEEESPVSWRWSSLGTLVPTPRHPAPPHPRSRGLTVLLRLRALGAQLVQEVAELGG